jgi:integrase
MIARQGPTAMQKKITKRAVDDMRAGQFLWDTELKGFGVKCTKSSTKIYIVQVRMLGDSVIGPGGVVLPRSRVAPRRYTIGRHGSTWAPEEARERARTLLQAARDGKDPRAAVEQLRETPTLRQFADTYHAKRGASGKGKGQKLKKPRSIEEDKRNLKLHILPALGDKKLTAISADDIDSFHTRMKATPIAANRCLALLSHMFTVAMAAKDMPRGVNPCAEVEKFPEEARDRHLSPEEITRLGKALTASQKQEPAPALACIRLLILTGCRKAEILTLKWDWVKLDHGRLELPDSKTGKRVVPLGAAAITLLRTLPRELENPYVLPGRKEGKHLIGIQRIWRRVRKLAQLEDVRLHDLRHSFATVAVNSGDSLFLVGKVLGHKQARTTERYAHSQIDPLKAVADRTADSIAKALRGLGRRQKPAKPSADVVKFPKKGAKAGAAKP